MWVEVGPVDRVRRAKRVVVDGDDPVLVVAHGDEFFALANICIHRERELARGMVLRDRLVCPGHQWAFDLRTGWESVKSQCQPTYPVRVDDGVVYVDPTAPAVLSEPPGAEATGT